MMKSAKIIVILLLALFLYNGSYSQNYGPEKIKPFDVKFIKNKTLFIPFVDKVPIQCKDMTGWKEFNTDTKQENEWKRRVELAYANSSFDFIPFEVKNYAPDVMKKEKDKTGVALFYETDFYQNLYVKMAISEPKWEIIAIAPINGLILTDINDLTIMFNMLHYSMINGCNCYGDNFKQPMYRGHEDKYKKAIDDFTTDIRKKTFLVPKLEKDAKGYTKKNEKMNEALKLHWKLTQFEFLSQKEIDNRLSGSFSGMYYKQIPIYTANPKVNYTNYYFLTYPGNNVLFEFVGMTELKAANLKYVQTKIDNWLPYFLDSKRRKEYEEQKARPAAQPTAPVKQAPTKSKSTKTSPEKKQPEQAKPGQVKKK